MTLWLWATLAVADILPPEPVYREACPAGSAWKGGREGWRCVPVPCPTGEAGVRSGLCVETREAREPGPRGATYKHDVALGACDDATPCKAGKCKIEAWCAPPDVPTPLPELPAPEPTSPAPAAPAAPTAPAIPAEPAGAVPIGGCAHAPGLASLSGLALLGLLAARRARTGVARRSP